MACSAGTGPSVQPGRGSEAARDQFQPHSVRVVERQHGFAEPGHSLVSRHVKAAQALPPEVQRIRADRQGGRRHLPQPAPPTASARPGKNVSSVPGLPNPSP